MLSSTFLKLLIGFVLFVLQSNIRGGADIMELAAAILLGVAILVPLGVATFQLFRTARDYRRIYATHQKVGITISNAFAQVEV